MRLLSATHPHPLRRRLWLGGTWIGLVVAIVIVSQAWSRIGERSNQLSLGGDFVPAYAAGRLVREGRAVEVYDGAALAQTERRVVEEANLGPLPYYGAYLNPPFMAAAYAPLASLPYRTAAAVWLGVNLLCAAGAIVLLIGMLPGGARWRAWALVPLLVLISMPFWQAICHLQNACVSLFIVCMVVRFWRIDNRLAPMFSGIACGLLFYKPQLACAIVVMLFVTRGWRAVAGCSISIGGIAVFTLFALPGTLTAYLCRLQEMVAEIQNRPAYNWGRQVTPRGLWRLLIQGHNGGAQSIWVTVLTAIIVTAAVAALAKAAWPHVWRREEGGSLDGLIAATLATMPVLMPYYMDYDLLMLAVPAVLLAGEWMVSPPKYSLGNGGLIWAWTGLFVALYVNSGLSGQSRLNLAAPIVAIVAFGMMMRCWKSGGAAAGTALPASGEIAMAA